MSEREKQLEDALYKLVSYFGGPTLVSLKELGEDALVDLRMKVRIGDLIEARKALGQNL